MFSPTSNIHPESASFAPLAALLKQSKPPPLCAESRLPASTPASSWLFNTKQPRGSFGNKSQKCHSSPPYCSQNDSRVVPLAHTPSGNWAHCLSVLISSHCHFLALLSPQPPPSWSADPDLAVSRDRHMTSPLSDNSPLTDVAAFMLLLHSFFCPRVTYQTPLPQPLQPALLAFHVLTTSGPTLYLAGNWSVGSLC